MKRLAPFGFIVAGLLITAIACRAAAPAPPSPEPAGPPLEEVMRGFYQGKTLTLVVGYPPGGGYDLYARTLARHIGKYIPGNPDVIVQNMAGAGSLVAANHLYNVAAKEGTVFGTFARGLFQDQLTGSAEVKFDARKFNWLGSITEEVSVCVARADAPIKTIQQLIGSPTPLIVGGTGAGADTDDFPKVLNKVLNTNFRLISGYPGGSDINLAVERGEVQGRCGWSWSSVTSTRREWVDRKFINILVQLSTRKHPDLRDVPLVMDLAKSDEDRRLLEAIFARQTMGRPFTLPPGVPSERVAGLRKAFMDTMKDPEFAAEIEKQKLELNPVSGEDIDKLVERVFALPPAVVARFKEVLK